MPQNIIGPALTSTPATLNTLSAGQQQAIVRPNNPPPGIGGFLFDIPTDDLVELTSDITDYYVENNSAINDNIALKPEIVTLKGLVAELRYIPPQQNTTQPIPDALPNNPAMEPEFAPGQAEAMVAEIETAAAAEKAATDSGSVFDYYSAGQTTNPQQTRQSSAFLYFQKLWMNRQLVSVETPWGIFTSMAVQSLRANQEADSRYVSNFTISFKRVRFADDITIQPGQLVGRAVAQQAETVKTGSTTQGPTVNPSLLVQILGSPKP